MSHSFLPFEAHRPGTARGSALFIAVLAILTLGTTAAVTMMFAVGRNREVEIQVARANALNVAESGVKETFAEMNRQMAVAYNEETEFTVTDGQVFPGFFPWGRYLATVRSLGDDRWTMFATGTVSCAGYENIERTVSVVLEPERIVLRRARFGFALFADQTLSLSGNGLTDSYDSRLGPYSPLPAGAPYSNPYQNSRGDIGANGTVINDRATGTEVHGTISPGPRQTALFAGISEGGIEPLRRRIDLPPIPDTEAQAARAVNSNGTIVTLGGGSSYNPATMALTVTSRQTVQLGTPGGPPRTYYFSSVTTHGSGEKIQVIGPTIIYLAGDWTNNGSSQTGHAAAPPNFRIYGVGTGTININGASGFGGAIYAPRHDITFNGAGEMFGGYVGRTVTRSGSWRFHYDEALGDIDGGTPDPVTVGFRITGWFEGQPSSAEAP